MVIHIYQKLKTTQCTSIGEWINSGMSTQSLLLSNKKDWMDTCNNMGESQVHYTKWKQPDSNGNRMCHLQDILKKTRVWEQNSEQWLSGAMGER